MLDFINDIRKVKVSSRCQSVQVILGAFGVVSVYVLCSKSLLIRNYLMKMLLGAYQNERTYLDGINASV